MVALRRIFLPLLGALAGALIGTAVPVRAAGGGMTGAPAVPVTVAVVSPAPAAPVSGEFCLLPGA